MADNCIIGPVSIADPYLVSDVEPLDKEGKEFFKVRCTKPQARQLLGLVSHFTEKTVNGRKVYNLNGGYGVIPIDASTNISDGLIRPRGLYLVEDVLTDLRPASPNSVVGLTVRKLSDNFSGYLDMDYTTGYNDGTALSSSYPPSVKSNKFTDEFTTFDTSTVWYSVVTSGLTSSSITASGGDLTLAGAASTDGTRGVQLTTSRTVLGAPFSMEFGLEWAAAASSGRSHEVVLMLTPSKPATTTDAACSGVWVRLRSTPTTAYVDLLDVSSGGVSSWKYYTTLGSGQKTPTFTWSVDAAGKMTIKLDKNGGTSYSTILNGYTPSMSFGSGYYFTYRFANNSSTTATMKSERIEIYNYTDLQGLNVVALPANSTPVTTPSSGRVSEEGTIPLNLNPTGNLEYSISKDDFFDGSVKAWNSNYPDGVNRLVTSTWDVLSVGDFYLTNGLVRLVPIATGIEFYYWNGTAYVLLNTFTTGTITTLKPLYVSQERFTLQVNNTEWTVYRGKPFVSVSHPDSSLLYTRKTSYYHDGVVSNGLAADADVSMLTQNYSLVFAPYNLVANANAWGMETDVTEWTAVSSTVTQSSPGYGGTGNCLKCVTSNATTYEGIFQANRSVFPSTGMLGLNINVGAALWGSGTVYFYFTERDASNSIISNTWGDAINLTGSFVWYDDVFTISSNLTAKVDLQILTKAKSSTTFYADIIQIAPTPLTTATLWSLTPTITNRYGLMIMKQDPTTIKTDSIPASSLTVLGVYDQIKGTNSINHYYNLVRESTIRTLQQIGVK